MNPCTTATRIILCSTLGAYAVMGTACEPMSPHDARATHVGRVDLELGMHGPADGSPSFGRVSGLALDSTGRIIVADAESARVSVYSRGGRYALSLTPDVSPSTWCCITLHRGLVWVLDRQSNTYAGYMLGNSSSVPRERFVLPTPATWLNSRVSFDTLDRLIHVSDAAGLAQTSMREIRHFVAPVGGLSRVDTLPLIPSADLTRSRFLATRGAGSTLFRQPFGPAPLQAFGPSGEYAFAVSSRYEVFLWSADLAARRVVTQHVSPSDLTRSERRQAAQVLASIARGQRVPVSSLPFGVPAHRPVLQQLMFDQSGRLWVMRSVREGQPHLADVYDAGGRLVGVMTWPANVSLELGAIRDTVALGTTANAHGGQRVVRLTFRRRVPPSPRHEYELSDVARPRGGTPLLPVVTGGASRLVAARR